MKPSVCTGKYIYNVNRAYTKGNINDPYFENSQEYKKLYDTYFTCIFSEFSKVGLRKLPKG